MARDVRVETVRGTVVEMDRMQLAQFVSACDPFQIVGTRPANEGALQFVTISSTCRDEGHPQGYERKFDVITDGVRITEILKP